MLTILFDWIQRQQKMRYTSTYPGGTTQTFFSSSWPSTLCCTRYTNTLHTRLVLPTDKHKLRNTKHNNKPQGTYIALREHANYFISYSLMPILPSTPLTRSPTSSPKELPLLLISCRLYIGWRHYDVQLSSILHRETGIQAMASRIDTLQSFTQPKSVHLMQ